MREDFRFRCILLRRRIGIQRFLRKELVGDSLDIRNVDAGKISTQHLCLFVDLAIRIASRIEIADILRNDAQGSRVRLQRGQRSRQNAVQ